MLKVRESARFMAGFPISTEQPWLEINDRQTEITMWKSLTEKQLTTEQQRELAYFRHVDHV